MHKFPFRAHKWSFAGVNRFSHMPHNLRNYLNKTLWKSKYNVMSYTEYKTYRYNKVQIYVLSVFVTVSSKKKKGKEKRKRNKNPQMSA